VVSRAVGISRGELVAIESGSSRPTIDLLDRIARSLGSTIVEVVRSAQRADQATSSDSPRLGLPDIGRAIADLPAGGSKVERAAAAAIVYALDASGGNQSAAARLLGMERKAYVRRLARARRQQRRA
jgi:DNA-binding XRE family transcriptional regulator